jgi:hypothetical protein
MKCLFEVALAVGTVLVTAPAALADLTCDFTTSSFIAVQGNLIVPNNAKCNLLNSGTVSGNVSIGENASLVFEGNWTVAGYLHANNCAYVALNPYGYGSTVIGLSTQIEHCSGNSPMIGVFPAGAAFGSFGPNNLIGGSFRCANGTGQCILVQLHVGGNVYVVNNKTSAPSQINNNFMAKSLFCQSNSPAPTGSSNFVAGNPDNSTEGQCQGF